MWPFTVLDRRHWFLMGLVALFLATYFGLLSWGRIEESLEALAAHTSGAPVFQARVDRADAIFIVFMFLFLTPMALVAAAGAVAFVGAVLAGFLESLVRRPGMPDWVFTLVVYLTLSVAAYVTRSLWVPQADGFLSLIARAILAAYQ